SDLMAHIGQEVALRPIGGHRRIAGLDQLQFRQFAWRDVAIDTEDTRDPALLVLDLLGRAVQPGIGPAGTILRTPRPAVGQGILPLAADPGTVGLMNPIPAQSPETARVLRPRVDVDLPDLEG